MEKPNYNEYTVKELKEAISGIDARKYPENLIELQSLLEARLIESPEEEEQKSIYVSFSPRFFAYVVDILFLSFLLIAAYFIATGFEPSKYMFGNQPIIDITNYFLALVYFVVYWSQSGKTPGKSLIGIMVVDEKTGNPPTFGKSLLRYVGYFLSSALLGLGFLWVLWHPKRKAWHDVLSGTIVVWHGSYMNAEFEDEKT